MCNDYVDTPTTVLGAGSLYGQAGDYAGYSFNLTAGEEVVLGKDPSVCGIVFDMSNTEISRKHVGITYDAIRNQYRIMDYSSNGTWAGGQKLIKGTENYFPAGTIIELAGRKNVLQLGGNFGYQQMQQTMGQVHQQQVNQINQQFQQPSSQSSAGKGMAVASMVLGIISVVLGCCIPFVTFFTAVLGVIFGAVALKKKSLGKGMAIAGLICSIISLIPAAIVLVSGIGATAYLDSF